MAGLERYFGVLRRNCNGSSCGPWRKGLCMLACSSPVECGSLRTIGPRRVVDPCTEYAFRSYTNLSSKKLYGTVVSKSPSAGKPKAVIFDLGGVVVPSPQGIFDRFEEKWGLHPGSLVDTIKATGNGGSFAKMERGEYSVEEFCEPFKVEYESFTGSTITLSQVKEFAHALSDFTKCIPHEEVLEMFSWLKRQGIKVAILTNNFRRDDGQTTFPKELKDVDVVVQSCLEGIKKPEQAIFDLTLKRLGVEPEDAVFLDDLGGNLKTARLMGLSTIKVEDISEALSSLKGLLEVSDHTHQLHIPGTSAVSSKLQLPVEPLVQYLKEEHGLTQEEGEPVIRQFRHGQSNPTYYVAYGGEEMVLRKKPPGKLLPSAHAVEREYRVMEAVGQQSVPVPPLMSLCEDPSIIGTPFYLMKFVPGRIFKNPSLYELSPEERADYFTAMCKTLAAIHSVDLHKAKLQDFGKEGNFVKRQVSRWSKQYEASKTHSIPSMQSLIEWLPLNLPESERTTVVHGDYRMDNLIFAVGSPEVVSVLDWELSTLGDPISDLAYCCMAYHLPQDRPHLRGVEGLDCRAHGIPSEEEFVAQYCQLTGSQDITSQWSFYMAFTFFRVAAILQGVYKRSQQDQSSGANAASVGLMAEEFAKKGWEFAQNQSRKSGSVSSRSSWSSPSSSTDPNVSPGSSKRSYSTWAMQKPSLTHQGDIFHFILRKYSKLSSRDAPMSLMIRDTENFPPHLKTLRNKLLDFMVEEVYPVEKVLEAHQVSQDRWKPHPLVEELKAKARSAGLWNLFLPLETDPNIKFGAGLTNLEYAHLAEIMGRSLFASEMFNCSPPDTGNMEVLVKYGSEKQQEEWLSPLLSGDIRSCFAMTEPAVASSDATNIQSSIKKTGEMYTINGKKWWISGAVDHRCKICIFMGKTDPSASKYSQQSMILVPMDSPGVKVHRPLTVFGYDDAPSGHGEMEFVDVCVPQDNLILGEGRGFEIAQGRLGPGRIHHCMRLIGMAERALEMMTCRVQERTAFGKLLSSQGTILEGLAQSRLEVEQARLLTLKAAHLMDTVGNKQARKEIAMIKVVAPQMAQRVIDRAMQAHGAMGLSNDRPLAQFFSWARILRLADGPDEVHLSSVGKMELKGAASRNP